MKPEELKSIIKDYDALIVRSSTEVTADIIASASKLRVIGRAGVGLDNVDLPAATKKGIVAMNTPAGNTTSTAEHTFSMILSLARNVPQACSSIKSGKWDRGKFSGVELHGKTLGIIGFGRIGSTVAKFAKAFGMDVIVFDPYLSQEVAKQRGVEMFDLEAILKKSDYITIHIPKTSFMPSPVLAESSTIGTSPPYSSINTSRSDNCFLIFSIWAVLLMPGRSTLFTATTIETFAALI